MQSRSDLIDPAFSPVHRFSHDFTVRTELNMIMPPIFLIAVVAIAPADEVRAAAADVERLPHEAQAGVRYLTLYNIEPSRRMQALRVVNYTLNALSRTRTISHVTSISPTLVRFSVAQFAPRPDEFTAWFNAWEKLAESDPYLHLRTEVVEQGRGSRGEGQDTVNIHRSFLDSRSSHLIVSTDGGWTDLAAAARLRSATHSIGALLRADYFVATVTAAPQYYELAGIPDNETDFVKSLGLDRNVVDRLRANAGANVIVSGVTSKPRRIIWSQGPLGGVYVTLDVQQVDAERDPLRRPVSVEGRSWTAEERENPKTTLSSHSRRSSTLAFRFDASEWFAVAPNGLWRTALFNSAGKRQDAVPDRVAKDTSDPHGDGIVVPMISCIRCHRESGLRPFADDQTRLLAGRVDLFSDDPKIVQRAAEFYDEPRLQRQMNFDRETYAAALDRIAGGLKPDELADDLAAVVRNYAYLPITPDVAAREVGLSHEAFRAALATTQDPIILTLLEGRPVLRGQWDSSFAEAALVASEYLPSRHRGAEKTLPE
ncbi:MAG: hypothetical protein IT427_13170 [Pirellulales bacterium]|nr:hypothetical protein [Pirellulales bacterium]